MEVSRRSALGLLAVAGLSGCSFEPVAWTSPEPSPSPTNTDRHETLTPEFFATSFDPAPKTLEEGKSVALRISTPHFDAMLESVFVGTELGDRSAGYVRRTRPIRAPRGYELVAFVLRGGQPSYLPDSERSATVKLLMGDDTLTVEPPFGRFNLSTESYEMPWVMFAMCVPQGRPVKLEISDQGKTVVVDMRQGVPVDSEDWAAMRAFRERWAVRVTPGDGLFEQQITTVPPPPDKDGRAIEAQTTVFSLAVQPDALSGRLPWRPETGWAPAGKQWLKIQMNARVNFVPQTNPLVQFAIDVPNSFVYEDTAGKSYRAEQPRSITAAAISRQLAALDIIWLVPEADQRAILRCNPTGTMVAVYRDVDDVPAKFVGQPKQRFEFELEFAKVTKQR